MKPLIDNGEEIGLLLLQIKRIEKEIAELEKFINENDVTDSRIYHGNYPILSISEVPSKGIFHDVIIKNMQLLAAEVRKVLDAQMEEAKRELTVLFKKCCVATGE